MPAHTEEKESRVDASPLLHDKLGCLKEDRAKYCSSKNYEVVDVETSKDQEGGS